MSSQDGQPDYRICSFPLLSCECALCVFVYVSGLYFAGLFADFTQHPACQLTRQKTDNEADNNRREAHAILSFPHKHDKLYQQGCSPFGGIYILP